MDVVSEGMVWQGDVLYQMYHSLLQYNYNFDNSFVNEHFFELGMYETHSRLYIGMTVSTIIVEILKLNS